MGNKLMKNYIWKLCLRQNKYHVIALLIMLR